MAMSIEPKFLPYGKDFHVFFFHAKSPNDMEWASNTIKDLESYGFTGGCSGLHFDPSVSLHCLVIFQTLWRNQWY